MKHCKVEVYLLSFKLSLHPKLSETTTKPFSRADTVGRCGVMINFYQASEQKDRKLSITVSVRGQLIELGVVCDILARFASVPAI